MVEVGRAIARDDLVDEAHLAADLRLEITDGLGIGELRQFLRRQFVPLHVQDGGRAELARREALVELQGTADLFHEFRGDGLAGAVILRINRKDFRDECPVFVELGEHLHEVAGHAGSGHVLVAAFRQEAVQGVAELMEGGLDIVNGKHRGLVLRGGRKVAHVHDDRAHIHTVLHILLAEIVHPGAAALSVAGEPVLVEDTEEGTVGIRELVSLRHVIVDLHLGRGLNVDAIDLFRGSENSLGDAVRREVRAGDGFVQVILQGADFLRIVEPVPRLDLVAGNSFHVGDLFLCLAHGRIHDGLQESVHRLRITGHLVGQEILCGGLVAQQVRFLRPELHDLQDEGVVIVLSPVVATAGIGLECLFTERTVLAGGHKSGIGRNGHADGIPESIVLRQEVLAELLAQDGEAAVDFREAGLLLRIQADAIADKALIELLGDHLLLAVQAVHVLVHGLHPGKEAFVHEDGVSGFGDDRRHLLLDLLDRGGGVRFGEIEEDTGNLGKKVAGKLVGRDRILERGSVRIVDNRADFGLLGLDTGQDGGHVVCLRDLAERGRSVRCIPIFTENLSGLRAAGGHRQCHRCK